MTDQRACEPAGETLSAKLRRTTEAMARSASVDMTIWCEHSNAVISAAYLLEKPAAPVTPSEEVEALRAALRRIVRLGDPQIDRTFDQCSAALYDAYSTARAALADAPGEGV